MSSLSWKVEVDRATPSEWSQMLDLFDDANVYQTAAYGGVRWSEKNLSRLVLIRGDEVVGIAQFRIIRPTPLKFGMAYLRWGPLWERRGRRLDPEVPLRMVRAIEDEYLRKRRLYVRIVPNAFAGSPRAEVFQSAFSKFAVETQESENTYRTMLMDLAPSIEELRSSLDKKWRNQLTRAEKSGLTVISGCGREEFRAFCEIYLEMFKRKAFSTTVDVNEFGRMQELLPEPQRMRVLLCMDQGTLVAGMVASAMGNSAIYLLGATSDAGLTARGAYLLQWSLIAWLKEQGVRWYDLGGIDPENNPGVYHFKKGLSGVDICQSLPIAASASALSAGLVKAGLALQSFRSSLRPSSPPRLAKQPAVGS